MRNKVPQAGFTLIEMLVAIAAMTAVFGLLFHFAARGQRVARSQPEAADLHQRLRVAAAMLERDLLMAGAGPMHGVAAGPLVRYMPPIVPARTGARFPDPQLSYFTDRISIAYVPEGRLAAKLSSPMAGASSAVPIEAGAPGCPSGGLCGFSIGTRSLIFDGADVGAGYDLFSVTSTTAGLGHGSPDPDFSRAYDAETGYVVPVIHHVYYLDRANRRLMLYDGSQSDVPVVDNIVDLRFTYYLDPSPANVRRPAEGESNCVYAAGSPPAPRLTSLGGPVLAVASAAQFIDGPACGIAPRLFDADLLRIRRVRVTLRAQVGLADLRGSGDSFTQPGFATAPESQVPDMEITFDVAPRNMRGLR